MPQIHSRPSGASPENLCRTRETERIESDHQNVFAARIGMWTTPSGMLHSVPTFHGQEPRTAAWAAYHSLKASADFQGLCHMERRLGNKARWRWDLEWPGCG